MGLVTLAQARTELTRRRPLLDDLVIVRADLVELAAAFWVEHHDVWPKSSP